MQTIYKTTAAVATLLAASVGSAQAQHGHLEFCAPGSKPVPVLSTGDFDGDGTVTAKDTALLAELIGKGQYIAFFDRNADHALDKKDVAIVQAEAGKSSTTLDRELAGRITAPRPTGNCRAPSPPVSFPGQSRCTATVRTGFSVPKMHPWTTRSSRGHRKDSTTMPMADCGQFSIMRGLRRPASTAQNIPQATGLNRSPRRRKDSAAKPTCGTIMPGAVSRD